MTNYLILSYDTLDELVREVNRKGLEGWKPQGGLSVLPGTSNFIFLQAIVRDEVHVAIVHDRDRKRFVESQIAEASAGENSTCSKV